MGKSWWGKNMPFRVRGMMDLYFIYPWCLMEEIFPFCRRGRNRLSAGNMTRLPVLSLLAVCLFKSIFFSKDVVDYYNNGTEDGYKKFVPNKRKRREGTSTCFFSCKSFSYLYEYFFHFTLGSGSGGIRGNKNQIQGFSLHTDLLNP